MLDVDVDSSDNVTMGGYAYGAIAGSNAGGDFT